MGPSLTEQSVSVYLGEDVVARWDFNGEPSSFVNQHRVLTLPETEETTQRELRFHFAHLRDPKQVGESADPRRLALGIKSIEFLEQPL